MFSFKICTVRFVYGCERCVVVVVTIHVDVEIFALVFSAQSLII
jgi:hypothetical protein